MKDSLFIQPLTGSGPLQSTNRAGGALKADSDPNSARNEQAAAEFSKEYSAKETSANDIPTISNSETDESLNRNPELTDKSLLDPDMASIESGIYRFPEGENPFEDALNIRASQTLSESDVEIEAAELQTTSILSTIKTDALEDGQSLPDIEAIIEETTDLPAELTLSSAINEDAQEILQTIKSAEPNTSIAQDDIALAQTQTSQRHPLGAIEEMVAPIPTRQNRETANIDVSPQSDLRSHDLEDLDIDILEIEPEGAFDLTDIETQLNSRIEANAQQNIFPNAAQNTQGQPLMNLGMELAAPTVISGTMSVSAATQTGQPVPAPIANAIVSTVADAILTAKETPKGVVVQLDPPEMGRVYIDFMFDTDNRVNVVVKADNVESYNILRERSQDFLQMLSDNGFGDIDLSFEQQSSNSESSSNDEDPQSYGLSYAETAGDTLEASYRTPIYRVNEEQLRLDLRL